MLLSTTHGKGNTIFLCMRDGIILQDGTPGEVYTRPTCLDSALALGSPAINLLRTLPEGLGKDVRIPKGTKTIGIRPVHLSLASAGCPATVEYAELFGSETVLHLEVEGQHLTMVTESQQVFLRGQKIYVQLLPKKILFFDREEKRIPDNSL